MFKQETPLYNWCKPTAEMIGNFRPFTNEHVRAFKNQLKDTGQVCIQVKSAECKDDSYANVKNQIQEKLNEYGISYRASYIIIRVPNIISIHQST